VGEGGTFLQLVITNGNIDHETSVDVFKTSAHKTMKHHNPDWDFETPEEGVSKRKRSSHIKEERESIEESKFIKKGENSNGCG